LDQIHAAFPERELDKPNPDRIKHHIKSHVIYTSQHGPVYKETDDKYNRESRFMPGEAYPVTGDISIIGEYVIMISFGDDNRAIGISIRNAEMARSMKTIFDMCWKLSENYQ